MNAILKRLLSAAAFAAVGFGLALRRPFADGDAGGDRRLFLGRGRFCLGPDRCGKRNRRNDGQCSAQVVHGQSLLGSGFAATYHAGRTMSGLRATFGEN